jgi:hypothetical protein
MIFLIAFNKKFPKLQTGTYPNCLLLSRLFETSDCISHRYNAVNGI